MKIDSKKSTNQASAIERFAARLFPKDDELRNMFISSLLVGEGARSAILDLLSDHQTIKQEPDSISGSEGVSWMPSWVRITGDAESPGKAAQFLNGDWYVLDQSSIFCASPLLEISERVELALDLCAAPGGKTCFLWKACQPKLILANEKVHGRLKSLISNIKRCKIDPCVITSKDPFILGENLTNLFDLVLVDVPCSGQSLKIKGKVPSGAFHRATINLNVKRQRKILRSAAKCVKEGGYLLYSTCTFSKEENEDILSWFIEKFNFFSALELSFLRNYRSQFTSIPCYRLWPFQGQGAGGFTCILKKASADPNQASNGEVEFPHIEWSSRNGEIALEGITA